MSDHFAGFGKMVAPNGRGRDGMLRRELASGSHGHRGCGWRRGYRVGDSMELGP